MQKSEFTTEILTSSANITLTESISKSLKNINNKLFDAIKETSLNRVKELIGKGAYVNAKCYITNNRLHSAYLLKEHKICVVSYINCNKAYDDALGSKFLLN